MNDKNDILTTIARYRVTGKDVVSFLHANLVEAGIPVYVVITDTNTTFSKVSKAITGQPYNHVSISFSDDLEELYTYALTTSINGLFGGIKKENKKMLKGSRYTLYSVSVPYEAFDKLKEYVDDKVSNPTNTRYNHLGLINAIFDKNIFNNDDERRNICSEFLVNAFKAIDVDLGVRGRSVIRPYDLVKNRMLKHVKRGTF